MSDLTIDAIRAALNGITAQQHAIANNMANTETPGFIATKVSFEGQLKNAIDAGDPRSAAVEVTKSNEPTNIQGNNVQVDDEHVAMIESNLQYTLMVQAVNSKFSLLRTAIRGQ